MNLPAFGALFFRAAKFLCHIAQKGPLHGWGVPTAQRPCCFSSYNVSEIVGVAALVRRENGHIAEARVGLTNMAATPLRAAAGEAALAGADGPQAVARAARSAAEGAQPGDVRLAAVGDQGGEDRGGPVPDGEVRDLAQSGGIGVEADGRRAGGPGDDRIRVQPTVSLRGARGDRR